MELFKFELKKICFFQKGLLIGGLCLAVTCLFLVLFPEMKDPRIKESSFQYMKLLNEFYGNDSPEKQNEIRKRYTEVNETLAEFEIMHKKYSEGILSESEWKTYSERYEKAKVIENAVNIFFETADRFSHQNTEINAQYIYQYSWNTIFFLHSFPNIPLLLGILFISTSIFPMEVNSGMLTIIKSSKNGRYHFIIVKTVVLILFITVLCFLGLLAELVIFYLRGMLNDSNAPVQSIQFFTDAAINVTLRQALVISLLIRTGGMISIGLLSFCLSTVIQGNMQAFLTSIGILIISYLLLLITNKGEGVLPFLGIYFASSSEVIKRINSINSIIGSLIIRFIEVLSGCILMIKYFVHDK